MKLCPVVRCLLFLSLLVMASCSHRPPSPAPPPPPNLDHSITMNWQQSFANNGACSSTITTSCITGFVQGYLDTTGKQVQLHSDTTAVCAGTTQPESCTSTFNGVLPIGAVTFYVATTYTNQSGTAGTTAAVTSQPVTVAADSPASLTVTINN